jgi:hypothetical protein
VQRHRKHKTRDGDGSEHAQHTTYRDSEKYSLDNKANRRAKSKARPESPADGSASASAPAQGVAHVKRNKPRSDGKGKAPAQDTYRDLELSHVTAPTNTEFEKLKNELEQLKKVSF